LQDCAAAIFSTVTDDTPATNGTSSITAPFASTNGGGGAGWTRATGAGRGVSLLKAEQPLDSTAIMERTAHKRFMANPD
jgi:hypothetical protein